MPPNLRLLLTFCVTFFPNFVILLGYKLKSSFDRSFFAYAYWILFQRFTLKPAS
jgi:hypothetical protein